MAEETDTECADPSDFVGAWSLLSWTIENACGIFSEPFGNAPLGMIAYSDAGTVHATFSRQGRARLGLEFGQIQAVRRYLLGLDSQPEGIDLAKVQGLFLRSALEFNGYCGTYSVEGRRVFHRVTTAVIPEWEEHVLIRNFAFEDDLLVLSTDTPEQKDKLVWKRLPARQRNARKN